MPWPSQTRHPLSVSQSATAIATCHSNFMLFSDHQVTSLIILLLQVKGTMLS